MTCNLISLPVNVLMKISRYLTFKEIGNCACVSVAWREAFNNELIWSWFYHEYFVSRIGKNCNSDLFLESSSFVEPSLNLPENKSCRLSALCESRINCMVQNHIDRNWNTGNYVAFRFRKELAGGIGYIECQDNLLLDQNPYRGNSFTVWDITGKPIELGSISYSINHHTHATYFKFSGRFVIVVQYNLLQVYHKQSMWPMFKLKYRKLFDQPEEDSNMIPYQDDVTEWYDEYYLRQYMQNYRFCFCTNGSFFAGSYYDKIPTIHVWNIETSAKLKEISLPEPKEAVRKCILVMSSKYLFITFRLSNSTSERNSTLIHSYSLQNQELTSLKLFFYAVDNVLFKNDYIISIDEIKFIINIYNYESGVKMYSIKEKVNFVPQTVDVIDNYVVYAVGKKKDEFYPLTEVKIKKLEKSSVIDFFKYTAKDLSNMYIYLIRQRFLIISNWVCSYYKTYVIDIWNAKEGAVSFEIDNARAYCFEHHDSKILVQMADYLHQVLHFY